MNSNNQSEKLALAVVLTATVTFALSGLLFFSFYRLISRRKSHYITTPITPFHRAMIDEGGLDTAPKLCFHCKKQSVVEKEIQEVPFVPSDVVNPPPPPPLPPALPVKKAGVSPPPPRAGFTRPPDAAKGGKDELRFKPLHWDKVTPANAEHSIVWDRITGGSTGLDEDLLETLFGYIPAGDLRRPSASSSPTPNPNPPQIRLLDPRKSQNTAIIIRTISSSRHEILQTLIHGQTLDPDTIEKLSRISLTPDEQTLILSFPDDPSNLAYAESFLFSLLKSVPSAFPRISTLHFRSSVYAPEIQTLKESLHILDLACHELRNRPLFVKLLEAVLRAGNRMNAGTSRGNAQAFDLSALRKLVDVKSIDGKTNLLQFVVEEVVRSEGKRIEGEGEYIVLGLPIVAGLSAEFSNVKKGAVVDHDGFVGSTDSLKARLDEIGKMVESWKGEEGGFVREMREFVGMADAEIGGLKEKQGMVMEKVRRTTEYYQPGISTKKGTDPLHLFVIVRDFLAMVDQACVEIGRNVGKRNGVGITTRFWSSPAQFVSGSSVLSFDSGEEDEF